MRCSGAKPVFVDIDPRTYNLDPALLSAAITPHTKAVVTVSLYGQCAEMDAINAIASERGIAVIEDGAQSFGATYKGRQSCNLSTIGCTSFFPSKPLGCYGDGGACFSNDEVLATRMRQIRVHGQDRRYHHPLVGINGRIDTLQAAILLAKLEAFDSEVRLRSQLGAAYSDQLADVVTTPYIEPHNTSVFAQYTIQVDNRQALQDRLNEDRIPTAVHYPVPLHLQPAFAKPGIERGSFPLSESAADHVVSLPMHPYMSESDQQKVVTAVRAATGRAKIASHPLRLIRRSRVSGKRHVGAPRDCETPKRMSSKSVAPANLAATERLYRVHAPTHSQIRIGHSARGHEYTSAVLCCGATDPAATPAARE